MKNIIFIVNTEFHLLVSLIFYLKYFYKKKYSIKMIMIIQGNRFRHQFYIPFKVYKIPNDLISISFKNNIFDYNGFIQNNFSESSKVYAFLDTNFVNTVIISSFKKLGAEINLIQEGMNAYAYFKKSPGLLFKKIKVFLKFLYFRYILKLRGVKLVGLWGQNTYVDNIYLTAPEYFNNKNKANLFELDYSLDNYLQKKIKKYFNIPSLNNLLFHRKKVVLFISQGFFNKKIRKFEFEILKKIAKFCDELNCHFMVKTHPRENSDEYKNFFGTHIDIIDANIPVEILINELTNSYILSWYSSSLLFNVPTNKYFWLYPMIFTNINIDMIPKHIQIIYTFEELYSQIQREF